jgi:iron complex outermembrane receptor protein
MLDPHVEATSTAAFGQATFEMTTVMSATAGLRYTREEKTIDNFGARYPLTSLDTPIPGSLYDYTDSIVHTALTPKFGVDFTLGRDGLAYVSATRGFKSGGFNLSSPQPGRGFAPEWAWSYEAGFKTSIMDGRARVAVAAFTMDYTNLQVQTPIGIGVFDIRNAASATIRGVEVEGRSRLGRGFEVGGHLTWLDAAYDQYQAVSLEGIARDVAGHHLNNAPQWAGRLAIDWNGRLTSSDVLTLTLDATAQSTVFFTPFNDAIQRQDPYALLGVRAEYGPHHGRWSINAYGRNVANAGYVMATFATSPAAFGGRPGAPRQWGVQLIVRH